MRRSFMIRMRASQTSSRDLARRLACWLARFAFGSASALMVWTMLAVTPAWAVISKVQDGAAMVLGTNPSVTLGTNVAAGDMLAACIHTGSGIFSVGDSQGNTWNAANPAVSGGMAFYWVQAAKGGATTVNLTCSSASAFCGFTVAEFSGMGNAPAQDGVWVESAYGTAGTIQTNTIGTDGANPELVLGCGFTDSVQTPGGVVDYGAGGGTPTAFTNQGQTSSSGGETLMGAFQSVSSAGPFGFQWTVTSSSTAGAIAAFLPMNATVSQQALCPQGRGVSGVCGYPPTTVAGLSFQVCPSGTFCTSIVTDANAACSPGSAPSGGGSNPCGVIWNGSAYVEY